MSNKGCKVPDCPNKHKGHGYCDNHLKHVKKHGKVLERTIYDKNEILDKGDHFAIVLRNKQQEVVGEALVDKEDLSKVKDFKWSLEVRGYAVSSNRSHYFKMHRYLMDVKEGQQVDHINGNPLDNRRVNLRFATAAQNAMNKSSKGVSFRADTGRYRARIRVDGRTINLGSFDTEGEAIDVRLKAEKEYFGEWGRKREQ